MKQALVAQIIKNPKYFITKRKKVIKLFSEKRRPTDVGIDAVGYHYWGFQHVMCYITTFFVKSQRFPSSDEILDNLSSSVTVDMPQELIDDYNLIYDFATNKKKANIENSKLKEDFDKNINEFYKDAVLNTILESETSGDLDLEKLKGIVNDFDAVDLPTSRPLFELEDLPSAVIAPWPELGKWNIGSLIVFIGKTGEGKTTTLANVAAEYTKLGKNVYYITFEESYAEIQRKIICASYYFDLKDKIVSYKQLSPDLLNPIVKHPGHIEIYSHNYAVDGFEVSPDTVINMVKSRETELNLKFDVIVLDYLDCISDSDISGHYKYINPHMGEEVIVRKMIHNLRNNNLIMVSACQTNRNAQKDGEKARMEHVKGSIGRLNAASYIYAVNKIKADKITEITGSKDRDNDNSPPLLAMKYDLFHLEPMSAGEYYDVRNDRENDEFNEICKKLSEKLETTKTGERIIRVIEFNALLNNDNKHEIMARMRQTGVISEVSKTKAWNGNNCRVHIIDENLLNKVLGGSHVK